jgi:phage FluMu gp28-like protein
LADKVRQKKLTDEERQEFLTELRADAGSEEVWLEEFCCEPIDESTTLLSYELINSCVTDDVLKPLEEITADYYVGFDVARKKDLSVIAGGEKLGDVKYTRQLEILEKERFRDQKVRLYKHLTHNTFRRSGIDATGIGAQIAEDAAIDHGKYKNEEITFTGPMKEELAFLMLRTFEDKLIRIPDDPALKDDLHSIKKIVTASGHIRFDAERSETDGHGDRFWAIALMLNAATTKKGGKARVTSTRRRSKITAGFGSNLKGLGGFLRRGGFGNT